MISEKHIFKFKKDYKHKLTTPLNFGGTTPEKNGTNDVHTSA